jgi:hypothetical protein
LGLKKLLFFILFLTMVFDSKRVSAQSINDIAKKYLIVSSPYPLMDNDQQNSSDVYFRFGWPAKAPYVIAIQFVNHGYNTQKFKFAIKDVTLNKMIILGTVHKSTSGYETLNPNAQGIIWSGPVDNINDSFSLHVWDSSGNEFDKVPISIKTQE